MTFHQGYSVVIGIGSYPYAPSLDANAAITAADVETVAKLLTDKEICAYPSDQVRAICHAAATRAGLLEAFNELASRVTADSTVLLFYCGHGEYGLDGHYYLTTHDTQLSDGRVIPGTGLRDDELLEKLCAIAAQRVLVIFNACHTGVSNSVQGTTFVERRVHPLPGKYASAILATGVGRVVITSCKEGQVAVTGPGPLTTFTQALVASLQGDISNSQNGYIGLYHLYAQLYSYFEEILTREGLSIALTRQGIRQEPELTVLEGMHSFTVALCRGASGLGVFEGEDLPKQLPVRQIDSRRSQLALSSYGVSSDVRPDSSTRPGNQGLLSFNNSQIGDISIEDVAGRDITEIDASGSLGSLIQPQGPVYQVFGNQHNINTGDGSYYEHYEDNREGTFMSSSKYEFSGTFNNTIFNIESKIDNSTQTLNASSNGTLDARAQVEELLTQLKTELKKIPPERAAQAEAVADMAKETIDEAAKPQPKPHKLESNADGLKKAAEKIQDVLPTVLAIATKIATTIMAFA